MKKIKTFAICAIVLAAMSFTTTKATPTEMAAQKMAEVAMTTAVDMGYITISDKQQVIDSGIVEAMAKTLVDTNYNLNATVDKGAEIAVEQGWFRSKADAKKALRHGLDKARKDDNLVKKVYNLLGI